MRPRLSGLQRGLRRHLTTVLIGGMCLYYERFLFVPGVFVTGYLIRVLRTAEDGTIPEFDDWADLVVVGVKGQLIWFSYLVLIPGFVVLLTASEVVEQGRALDVMTGFVFEPYTYVLTVGNYLAEFAGVADEVSAGVLALEPVLVFALMLYLFPAALQAFAEDDRFVAAFATKRLRARVADPGYFVAWVQFVCLWGTGVIMVSFPFFFEAAITDLVLAHVGVGFVGNTLEELPVVLSAHVGFVLTVAAYYVLARRHERTIDSMVRGLVPAWLAEHVRRNSPSDHAVRVVAVGGLLLSTGVVVVCAIALGYVVRVVRSVEQGGSGFPPFDGWWRLWKDGVRVAVLWAGYTLLPALVLLYGQPTLLPGRVTVSSLRLANTVVGGLGLPVGPMVAYDGDRVVREVLVRTGMGSPATNNPFLVRDVAAVSPLVWVAVVLLALVAVYLLPAAVYRLSMADGTVSPLREGFALRAVARLALRPTYARHWGAGVLVWTFGSLPALVWNVWRRELIYRGVRADAPVRSLDVLNEILPAFVPVRVEAPLPTAAGMTSAFVLILSSLLCFAYLIWGYALVAEGCELAGGVDEPLAEEE